MSGAESLITLDELIAEFDFLGDWESKCDYLIDLGFGQPKLSAADKSELHLVRGCQSLVWLVPRVSGAQPPVVDFDAESDAMIVNGLIAVLRAIYAGHTADEVLAINPQAVFARLGLERHLSSQRKNGLYGMVQRIRDVAAAALAANPATGNSPPAASRG